MILAWKGSEKEVPEGWLLCNGENVTPDLRGRFILGSGKGARLTLRSVGSKGGTEQEELTVNQMPKHKHPEERAAPNSWGFHTLNSGSKDKSRARGGAVANGGNWHKGGSSTMPTHQHGDIGGEQPHNNMPPFYVLAYIMKK